MVDPERFESCPVVVAPGDGAGPGAGPGPHLHVEAGVADHHRLGRSHPGTPADLEQHLRVGLGLPHVLVGHDRIEVAPQTVGLHEGVKAPRSTAGRQCQGDVVGNEISNQSPDAAEGPRPGDTVQVEICPVGRHQSGDRRVLDSRDRMSEELIEWESDRRVGR